MLEIDPRAPYRRFLDNQKVEYGLNPARINTPGNRRYNSYRTATTIGAARRPARILVLIFKRLP
jgi:hypothetical protein